MLEGKLIIIPALGHQNKGKSSFTGSGLFVLMSQCGNNNELALQHGGFCTTWSLLAKGLLNVETATLLPGLSVSRNGVAKVISQSQRMAYDYCGKFLVDEKLNQKEL